MSEHYSVDRSLKQGEFIIIPRRYRIYGELVIYNVQTKLITRCDENVCVVLYSQSFVFVD